MRVVASILVNGIALLHYLTKLYGLELPGYEAAPWKVANAETKARQIAAIISLLG
jgi:hypothetical protein